jgi:hypothetical protein
MNLMLINVSTRKVRRAVRLPDAHGIGLRPGIEKTDQGFFPAAAARGPQAATRPPRRREE